MLLLRREYVDGPERPELVLLHAEVYSPDAAGRRIDRCTRVVAPTGAPGRRAAFVSLPDPREGERFVVRYRFSAVRDGTERISPLYETSVPPDGALGDLHRVPEEGGGNLPPAPGCGHFLVTLPLEEGEDAAGVFRYGFGAMRKKPSPALCRAAVDAGSGPAPVVEGPEPVRDGGERVSGGAGGGRGGVLRGKPGRLPRRAPLGAFPHSGAARFRGVRLRSV